MNYVAGFLFNPELNRVLLVKKSKPAWQVGALNAIGGKIENGETRQAAMVREFEEETGVRTIIETWKFFATLEVKDGGGTVHFAAGSSDPFSGGNPAL
jgi:8-oxo-dGTP diphosphatase